MVGPDGVEDGGPGVARVPQAVQEYQRRLLAATNISNIMSIVCASVILVLQVISSVTRSQNTPLQHG